MPHLVAQQVGRRELAKVTAWMNEPTVAEPMDIAPPVRRQDVQQRVLPIFSRGNVRLYESVGLYALREIGRSLVGFGVTYGWDHADDPIRELDVGLPALRKNAPRLAFEALVRLAEASFYYERAVETRTFLRGHGVGLGLPKVFAAIGARQVAVPPSVSPRDAAHGRVLYTLNLDDFVASRGARLFGVPLLRAAQ